MKRNDIVQLKELREGDRFTYLKRVDPWQVMENAGAKVAVNQVLPWGKTIHRHNDVKPGHMQVRFLRHTRPEPGEECNMEDLQKGDVFFFPDHVAKEYKVVDKEGDQIKRLVIRDLTNSQELPYWPNASDFVVLARREEVSR